MRVKRGGRDVKVEVRADGEGLVSHAGAGLIAETADRLGLTSALDRALGELFERAPTHSPGRVIRDLAVMLADGGEALCDLATVRDQEALFGPVASDSTAYRLIERDRRRVRTRWSGSARRARRPGRGRGGAARAPRLIEIDLDATLLVAHSDKDGAAGNFKGGFGFHPMLAYLDGSRGGARRPAAARQRGRQHRRRPDRGARRRAGAAAQARRGARADPRARRQRRRDARADRLLPRRAACASRSGSTSPSRSAPRSSTSARTRGCRRSPRTASRATTAPGSPRSPTRLDLSGWPAGSRVIVRRERPHPGAQLSLHRPRRAPLPGDPDRPARRRHRLPRSAPPRPRARRGPHQGRQGHRHGQAAVPRLRHERGLARALADRPRPARLDQGARARRRARAQRAQAPALPAAARRRPARLPRPPSDPAPRPRLALGQRTRRRLRAPRRRCPRPRAETAPAHPDDHPTAQADPHRPRRAAPTRSRFRGNAPARPPHPPRADIDAAHRPPDAFTQTRPTYREPPDARSGLSSAQRSRWPPARSPCALSSPLGQPPCRPVRMDRSRSLGLSTTRGRFSGSPLDLGVNRARRWLAEQGVSRLKKFCGGCAERERPAAALGWRLLAV